MFGGGQGGLDACVLKEFTRAADKGGEKRCGGGSPMMGAQPVKKTYLLLLIGRRQQP